MAPPPLPSTLLDTIGGGGGKEGIRASRMALSYPSQSSGAVVAMVDGWRLLYSSTATIERRRQCHQRDAGKCLPKEEESWREGGGEEEKMKN